MSFSRKVFISVFITTIALGAALIWISYSYVTQQATENFIARYSSLSQVLGDTLNQLDHNTEALMLNAAKVVAAKDSEFGLQSNDALKVLKSEINVTHIFIVDKKGNFIRSTNEDPKLIPNAFSFCPTYKDLITGKSDVEATPIIHPQPEPKPYKFLFIPSYDRQRLIEVGVRVDFIAKTLTEAMRSDSNLMSMSLYSPTGLAFGRFEPTGVIFNGATIDLPGVFPQILETKSSFNFYTKVKSSHPQCCQCDVAKTSRNGEYYYVLASEISKQELIATQATTKTAFSFIGLIYLILAYGFSRFVARRLVRNFETVVGRVRAIRESGNLKGRIKLDGQDEITYLSDEFDRLLDSLNESQQRIIEAEMVQAKVQLARDVAHNIKSPIIAIEMMLPMLSRLPERIQKVFRDSVKEVKELTERLSRRADALTGVDSPIAGSVLAVNLSTIVEDEVHKKQVEYLASFGTDIYFQTSIQERTLFIGVDPTEFRAVLSNLINNAIQSYESGNGKVVVNISADDENCLITVSDLGRGISDDVINNLGKIEISAGKHSGRGLGLTHAYRTISSWNGKISIDSSCGAGTTVTIKLPFYQLTVPDGMTADMGATYHQ